MSLMNWFNKPKWKSKDADTRLIAVKNDPSPELIAELPKISQNDGSKEVRVAATRRLKDYELIANIAKNDDSNDVKKTALKIISDWIQKETHTDQLDVIKSLNLNTIYESSAKNSKDAEVRKFCIEKINKQGLLADLIVSEPTVEIRQLIAVKITKSATLKRVAKALKNKDKSLAKSLLKRSESKSDRKNIKQQKATELCSQVESLIHKSQSSGLKDLQRIENNWNELSKEYNFCLLYTSPSPRD